MIAITYASFLIWFRFISDGYEINYNNDVQKVKQPTKVQTFISILSAISFHFSPLGNFYFIFYALFYETEHQLIMSAL